MTPNLLFEALPPPLHVALFFSAFYFLAALITGIWKWRAMLGADNGRAHAYVDIAHHAALHYGPFILLAGVLASFWPFGETFPAWILIEISGWTMVLSLSRYISLGVRGAISNQLDKPTASARIGLIFFFFGSVLPGTSIAVGAIIGLWVGLPGKPF
ncbi:hypothetical protein MNBD_ALPHA04-280 [hydrothermal vent metagenome]|uniref:Uncharacterized protein n=1 Tax=hydrothermal vent metagenome TaxID=652676 RepID=A0A3B0S4J2_9ZZZZ